MEVAGSSRSWTNASFWIQNLIRDQVNVSILEQGECPDFVNPEFFRQVVDLILILSVSHGFGKVFHLLDENAQCLKNQNQIIFYS